jgi:precorrin-6Y C5,15-methyltransferase (decarboxylating)
MNPVYVIGSEIGSNVLAEAYKDTVSRAEILVGGSALLDKWGSICSGARRVELGGAQGIPLHAAIDTLRNAWNNGLRVVVLADGDPLYFGIGTTLARNLPAGALRILPGLSVLQTACARLGLPWADVSSISLHGRDDWRPLAIAVQRGQPICVLGDSAHGPSELAAWLLDRGAVWLRMHLFTDLNTANERHMDLSLPDARAMRSASGFTREDNPDGGESGYTAPTILLVPEEGHNAPSFSLRLEARLPHAGNGLITKGPIRTGALAELDIQPHDVIWDIGSGTGAVAFAASTLAWAGWICAVESKPERVSMIRENRRHLAALNVDVIESLAPHGLSMLPDPNAVFVGGGLSDARRASDLLDAIVARLRPGGRIVAACVLFGSLERLRTYARSAGIEADVTMIQAAASQPLAGDLRLEAHNPVFLVSLHKAGL